ncbi:MAG: 2-phospho-L-lactate guanylyltransferase [Sciscionella sp.]
MSQNSWAVVVPVKKTSIAKTRLAPLPPTARSRLARAFACDTVTAALNCAAVHRVLVVTSDPVAAELVSRLGADVVPDVPAAGISPALEYAESVLRERYGCHRIVALSSDLPAVTPDTLAAVFVASAGQSYWLVADAAGEGTTALGAADVPLAPAFGNRSRWAHQAQGAADLAGGFERVRRDVDTIHDLRVAARLGLGTHTATVVRTLPGWQ